MRTALLRIAAPLAALAAGCGGANGTCTTMLDTCFANQQACVASGGVEQCVPCPDGQYAAHSGACEPIAGTATAHDFPDVTVAAGEEEKGICVSWTLGNATELWVNAVELSQGLASHHSNWFFVPNNKFTGPSDGIWPCATRNFDELSAALAGGVLYAQSTQTLHEVQKFPNGAAVRIPPWSQIIGNVHFLNASTSDVTGHYHLALYTLPLSEVQVKLVPFHLQYLGLDIPAHMQSRFFGECQVGEDYYAALNGQWDLQVYYILPHTHSMAHRFFVQTLGGTNDGQMLLDLPAYNGESHGRAYDPPVVMGDAKGFRFGCEYDNQRDVNVGWGFGDQEMCECLGFGATVLGFQSTVPTSKLMGTDGALQLYSGPCTTLTFNWDFNKPGGSPP
jgi:hypothetical protein